jgi:hypothetical protein
MVVLQALAQAQEPLATTHAAADVPTIAPVPVPMRAESGASLREEPVPPGESREPDEALVTEVPVPEPGGHEEPSTSGQQFGDLEPEPDSESTPRPEPEPAKPTARPRRPKKK